MSIDICCIMNLERHHYKIWSQSYAVSSSSMFHHVFALVQLPSLTITITIYSVKSYVPRVWCSITGNEETEDNKYVRIPLSRLCLYIDRYTQLQPNQHGVVILNPVEEVQYVNWTYIWSFAYNERKIRASYSQNRGKERETEKRKRRISSKKGKTIIMQYSYRMLGFV